MAELRWYRKPEMIVAFSALLMSVITTLVAIYSAYIDRQYARASVWPRLEIFRSMKEDNFHYGVSNSGNGPALIKYAVVTYQGKPIQSWQDIPDLPNFIQSHISTRILSPQSVIEPLAYRGSEVMPFLQADEQIQIQLCYCSIYEECWVTSRVNAPVEVGSCQVDDSQRFLE